MLGNSFIFNMAEAVAEGHVLAEKAGLEASLLKQYLSLFFPGAYESYSSRMTSGDYHSRDEVCHKNLGFIFGCLCNSEPASARSY